jgi:TolB-like protein
MSTKSLWLLRLVFLGLFCSSITVAGCSFTGGVPQWSGSGFIRKELLEYKKAAVLPFQGDSKGEASDTFAENFHEKFPQIELVKREQVLEVFQEQDLYSDRIDEATRRKIGQVFGVQAFIVGNVYYPSILRWLLQIQVIDVETGEIMGRSLVEINYVGAEGLKEACKIAVKHLTQK